MMRVFLMIEEHSGCIEGDSQKIRSVLHPLLLRVFLTPAFEEIPPPAVGGFRIPAQNGM